MAKIIIAKVFRIRIRIIGGLLDSDPHGKMQIRIQEVKSSEIGIGIFLLIDKAHTVFDIMVA